MLEKTMKKLINNNLLVLVCVLILPILIHWMWFLKFDILTNGDWWFFFKETQLTFFSLPYIWTSNTLGSVFLNASSYFSYLFTGLLGFVDNFPLSERLIYFWPSVLVSSLSAYMLVKKILNNKIAAIVGSFVYCYNTYFLLGQTGHLTLMTAFAIAPLIIYFFIKTLEEKKLNLAVVVGLLALVSAAYEFRAFYIIAFVLLFYFVYYTFFIDKISIKNVLKNSYFAIFPILIVFLLNFFWIFGLSKVGFLTDNAIFNRGLFGNSFMDILRSITLFHPFWNSSNVEFFVVQPIPLYFFLIPIFAFLGFMLSRKNKNVLFFGFIALLGVFLAKQVSAPFTDTYQWLYANFPGFNAFREASKFYFLIALGYSVLIGSFIDWVWQNWYRNKLETFGKYALTFLIAGLFLWNTKPVVTGEIEKLFVPRHIPNDYLILKDFILRQPDYFRTFWTPRESRWGIYVNNHPKISNVSVIESNWKNFSKTTGRTKQPLSQNRIVNIYKNSFSNNLFDISSIKYVVISLQDIANDDDFFIHYGGKDNSNIRNWYINELEKINFLEKINIGTKDLVIYENKNFRPHIYITKEKETVYQEIPYEKVKFGQKNPTEYRISLKNISQPAYLNFSESYHPDWRIRVGKFYWFKVLLNKNYFLPDKYHFKNDATLNSFLINPEYIKQIFSKEYYKENQDGSIDVELTLYFKPQSYLYLGLFISGTTFLACLVYLGYDFYRRRPQQKS